MVQDLSYLLTQVLYDSDNNGRAEAKTIRRGTMCLACSLGGVVWHTKNQVPRQNFEKICQCLSETF